MLLILESQPSWNQWMFSQFIMDTVSEATITDDFQDSLTT